MTRTAVALGSNMGDRLAHLRFAVEALGTLGPIEAVSSLYETDPIGGPNQGRYLNAVVVLETDVPALDLLAALQRIEAGAGRSRDVRWGPRTLDLDLIVFGSERIDLPTLEVPHPRAAERRFVVAPLGEVWPDAQLGGDVTAADALETLRGQRVVRFDGDWLVSVPGWGRRATAWVAAQVALFVVWGAVLVSTARLPVPEWAGWLGAVIAGGGLVLGVAAVMSLGRELTPYPHPRHGGVLVDRGPYRMVRHPIYGAIILGFLGLALFFASWPAVVVSSGVAAFFAAKSRIEERALVIGIPGYAGLLERVRRRFIPFVW